MVMPVRCRYVTLPAFVLSFNVRSKYIIRIPYNLKSHFPLGSVVSCHSLREYTEGLYNTSLTILVIATLP